MQVRCGRLSTRSAEEIEERFRSSADEWKEAVHSGGKSSGVHGMESIEVQTLTCAAATMTAALIVVRIFNQTTRSNRLERPIDSRLMHWLYPMDRRHWAIIAQPIAQRDLPISTTWHTLWYTVCNRFPCEDRLCLTLSRTESARDSRRDLPKVDDCSQSGAQIGKRAF